METFDQEKLERLSKEELIKILNKEFENRNSLKHELAKTKENSVNLVISKCLNIKQSKLVRSEEEYIANKLLKRLNDLQREKEALLKKVQLEEDNLT